MAIWILDRLARFLAVSFYIDGIRFGAREPDGLNDD